MQGHSGSGGWRSPLFAFSICLAVAGFGCGARAVRPQGGAPPAAAEKEASPGRLQGQVVGGRYVAPDGSFTASAPHPPESYEFKNMSISDGRTKDGAVALSYVIFGPGPSDPAGYHVIVAEGLRGQSDPRPVGERADAVTSSYMARYDALYHGTAERLVFAKRIVDAKPAIYCVYRYVYDASGKKRVFYVVFTVIKMSDDKLVNVMAEKLTLANPWYPGVDTLVAGEWTRFNDFAASVRVTP